MPDTTDIFAMALLRGGPWVIIPTLIFVIIAGIRMIWKARTSPSAQGGPARKKKWWQYTKGIASTLAGLFGVAATIVATVYAEDIRKSFPWPW